MAGEGDDTGRGSRHVWYVFISIFYLLCGIIVLRWSRSPMVTAGRNHSDIIFIFISHMVTRLLSTLV